MKQASTLVHFKYFPRYFSQAQNKEIEINCLDSVALMELDVEFLH